METHDRKQLIVIDPRGEMYESIMASDRLAINTLILNTQQYSDELASKYPDVTIFSTQNFYEFIIKQDIDLDYGLLRKYQSTQLKIEHYLSRETSDSNISQYLYVLALSYWVRKFTSGAIDGVLFHGLTHGRLCDEPIIDIAVAQGLPAYVLPLALAGRSGQFAYSIYDCRQREYMRIDRPWGGPRDLDEADFIFYADKNGHEPGDASAMKADHVSETTTLKRRARDLLTSIGGPVLVMAVARLLGRHPQSGKFFSHGLCRHVIGLANLRRLKSYYHANSVALDTSKKYVYYALHMEPEASIQVNTIFHNQLAIIKTICQELPDGWTLYVKEHPHQYKLNVDGATYFIPTLSKFRTKRFYDEIKKLPNTFLLNMETRSQDILRHAKATATINGTVMLESLVYNKPVLAFAQGTSVFTKAKGVFDIAGSSDCARALVAVEQEKSAEGEDVNTVLRNYLFAVDAGKAQIDCRLLTEHLFVGDTSTLPSS